jgi:hypothetical protein
VFTRYLHIRVDGRERVVKTFSPLWQKPFLEMSGWDQGDEQAEQG